MEQKKPFELEPIIDQKEWVTRVNQGCRSTNMGTRYKYLEYVGEICGYRNNLLEREPVTFDSDIVELSEEEYLKKVDEITITDSTIT
jgi:hypothetical protein